MQQEQAFPSEAPQSVIRPLTVEFEGKLFLVLAMTDIDGTAIDETKKEHERIATITPAREAVSLLEAARIPVGTATSRSTGEALHFQQELGGHGAAFSEDGAAVPLPDEHFSQTQLDQIKKDPRVADIVQMDGRHIIRLSNVSLERIDAFLAHVDEQVHQQDPTQQLVSTRTSDSETLMRVAEHATQEAAISSAKRIASAYVASPTPLQRDIIEKDAPAWGIRAHGDHINLIGADANKANAMRFILDNVQFFFPRIKNLAGAIPIFFGNGPNDLPFLEQAEVMGGIGVLVAHPNGGYWIDEAKIPPSVIKTTKPFGYGMREALPQIADRLKSRYNVSITIDE